MGLGEMYGSVMSLYNLADDLKAEAMFYIVSRFLRAGYGFVLVQLLQSVFAHSFTVICNGEDAGAIFQSYRKYGPVARWVVDHAVADEVGKLKVNLIRGVVEWEEGEYTEMPGEVQKYYSE